jgi:hypothetical protein
LERVENRQLLSTFPVTTTADNGPGSLRAQIAAANAAGGANTVTVPGGTYTLTSGALSITSDMTISGAGAGSTVVDGSGLSNDFNLTGSITANFSGLTIRHAGGGSTTGVGILGNQATINVTACDLTNNAVDGIKTGSGSVTVANSTFSNTSQTGEGILSTSGGSIMVTNGTFSGLALGIDSASATVTIADSTFSNNYDSLTSNGTVLMTNSIIRNDSDDGIDGSNILTIIGSSITGNAHDGIDGNNTLTLTNSTISGNGNDGVDAPGTMTMTNSTISSNGEDGIDAPNTLTMTNSTISSNTRDGIDGPDTLTMTNSTISGNGQDGIDGGPSVTLNFVTIADNGFGIDGSKGTIGNSIVAFNGTNGTVGSLTSQGHNISSDGSLAATFTQPGDLNNTDPKIGPLADNGGPTFTQALLAGSPALDAASGVGAPDTDQRGVARPQGGGFDIGAFELQVTTTTDTTTRLNPSTSTPPVGQPFTITAIVTPTSGTRIPTGDVIFTIDGVAQPPVSLTPVNGVSQATFTTSSLSVGQHTIGATYNGAPGFNSSPATPITVTVVTPPTVVSLQRFGFHAQPTVLVLSFSTAMDPNPAENTNNYQIQTFYGRGHLGPGTIPVAHAVYNVATDQVVLYPAQRLSLHRTYALTVHGTPPGGLTNAAGVPLLGNGSDPGTNYEALITKHLLAGRSDQAPVVTAGNRLPARRVSAAAVDALAVAGRPKLGQALVGRPLLSGRHSG